LEQVATELSVSRERVRQIERRALRKLRHPLRARRLRAYVRF
jgi:RNA polymerase primary sigma factor